jgi:hypothetical protein
VVLSLGHLDVAQNFIEFGWCLDLAQQALVTFAAKITHPTVIITIVSIDV